MDDQTDPDIAHVLRHQLIPDWYDQGVEQNLSLGGSPAIDVRLNGAGMLCNAFNGQRVTAALAGKRENRVEYAHMHLFILSVLSSSSHFYPLIN
ncbi:hypothetical protein ABWH97_11275 [Nitratireductor sp. ac15]